MVSSVIEDLVCLPGTTIRTSTSVPTGVGSNDPQVLVGNNTDGLDGQSVKAFADTPTFDTYDGQNAAHGPDWYEVSFCEPQRINALRVVMGLPYRDGGWWMDVWVEVPDTASEWSRVECVRTPAKLGGDHAAGRRPFESVTFRFNDTIMSRFRIIGRPGGSAEFTSLARISAFHFDHSRQRFKEYLTYPIPLTYQIVNPDTVWDLSESIITLSGFLITCDMLEYYLEPERYRRYWARIMEEFGGDPPLWRLIGQRIGWRTFNQQGNLVKEEKRRGEAHVIGTFYRGLFLRAQMRLEVNDIYLGTLATGIPLIHEEADKEIHRTVAADLGFSWSEYIGALNSMKRIAPDRLHAIGTLLGAVGKLIVDQARQNLLLQSRLSEYRTEKRKRIEKKSRIVEQAIAWMQENLEDCIGVQDVAREIGVSHQYLSSVFRDHLGRTAIEILTELKIERAKHLFDHEGMSVTDVAVALGYNPEYFSRAFHRRVGMSPSDFANRIPH